MTDRSNPLRHRHATVALVCCVFVVAMVGAAYAAVPLYRMFCQVTGFGGVTQRAEAGPGQILDRTIEVRFDSNVAPDLPWRFTPKQRTIRVRLGEEVRIAYEVENLSDEPTAGTATYNVTPTLTGSYFSKIECFCFTEQVLEPNQTVEMPVVFFVDPRLVDDAEVKNTPSIVLSYTFYKTPLPDRPTAGAEQAASPNP